MLETGTHSPASRRVHQAEPGARREPDPDLSPRSTRWWAAVLAGTLTGMILGASVVHWGVASGLTEAIWAERAALRSGGEKVPGGSGDHAHDDGADRHHHPEDGTHIALSAQARRNIGLTLATLSPQGFTRSIQVPGVVAERPGRTLVAVSAPLGGIVEEVVPLQGEAVAPGTALFVLRLTDEDLVDRQRAMLLAIEELDVVEREITRLEEVTASGAVAGRNLLERQYRRQSIEAAIRAERQALILHGLSDEQVEQIAQSRQLLSRLVVSAPSAAHEDTPTAAHEDTPSRSFQVVEIAARPGDHLQTGTALAVLADYGELYVRGNAFERDAAALYQAAYGGTGVDMLVEGNGAGKEVVSALEILYVENAIDQESRALHFFVSLPNEVVRDHRTSDDRRFLAWRFKPGQRVQVQVPLERWEDRFVLPVEAVVQDGAESFVFQQIEEDFVRREVHVEYRDQRSAIIAVDGSLSVGDVVAVRGAYQIHLALKQQAGGAGHADHHHHH